MTPRMPVSSIDKSILQTPGEKPHHFHYLRDFRVEQCPLFLQHKCTQHRPFTCFHWHFQNQRRRRPIRRKDGTYNYSPDVYCTKYDETSGICPDGDDCPYLHRVAGDTERRYHLRYYKTGMCVHDTDSRGWCVKNGQHCAFAHGSHDLRAPVYDIRDTNLSDSLDLDGVTGPNTLDKERSLMSDDPKWQDTNYVLANYKTEQCKRPPRLCRQGYACPQYHNAKDKRRSPKKYKYRSTPCPNVKGGDEWGDPANCETGDQCTYCHTRTEQQFHPEIYKSTKCNDMQQNHYCPRGAFCAFAHVDQEMLSSRDSPGASEPGTSLAELLALSSSGAAGKDEASSKDQEVFSMKKVGPVQEKLETALNGVVMPGPSSGPLPIGGERSFSSDLKFTEEVDLYAPQLMAGASSAPGAVAGANANPVSNPAAILGGILKDPPTLTHRRHTFSSGSQFPMSTSSQSHPSYRHTVSNSGSTGSGLNGSIFSDPFSSTRSPLGGSFQTTDQYKDSAQTAVEFALGAFDDLHYTDEAKDSLGIGSHFGPASDDSGKGSAGSSSAPMAIPGSRRFDFVGSSLSPKDSNTTMSDIFNADRKFGSFPSAAIAPGLPNSQSPLGLFGPPVPTTGAGAAPLSLPSDHAASEIARLREELWMNRRRVSSWEDRISQARTACQAWQREAEEAKLREQMALQQNEEIRARLNMLFTELGLSNQQHAHKEGLERLSISSLKAIYDHLKQDVERVEAALYHSTNGTSQLPKP
ncbi:unnamed protein product [Cyprideis torosa]|uniref:Uncharacterized protein n=1 Tax=Cyprideis torosa TaxID=163714 RepID=A0A7R8W0H7_9CRUS|nr:unnamed protein product [Cyprideis torosa]CAG0879763.1 unnamed protein product [Cyprideis torosa]